MSAARASVCGCGRSTRCLVVAVCLIAALLINQESGKMLPGAIYSAWADAGVAWRPAQQQSEKQLQDPGDAPRPEAASAPAAAPTSHGVGSGIARAVDPMPANATLSPPRHAPAALSPASMRAIAQAPAGLEDAEFFVTGMRHSRRAQSYADAASGKSALAERCRSATHLPAAVRKMCPTGVHDHDEAFAEVYGIGERLLGRSDLDQMLKTAAVAAGKFSGKRVGIWYDPTTPNHGIKVIMREQGKDVYHFKKYGSNLNHDDWIVDFGGNIGAGAVHERMVAPAASIVTIEPSPVNYFWLVFNMVANGLDSCSGKSVAIMAGLAVNPGRAHGAHRGGRTHIGAAADSKWMKEAESHHWKPFQVNMMTMPMLMQAFNIHYISLMKFDCEGCEYLLALEWIKLGLFAKIHAISGEFHLVCNYKQNAEYGLTNDEVHRIWHVFCRTKNYEFEKNPGMGCQCPEYANGS